MGLSNEQVQALLNKELNKGKGATGVDSSKFHPRPIQIGPLKFWETSDRCTSRGCGAPTTIKVNGAPKCTSHALYELNFLIIERIYGPEWLATCTCKAGMYSKFNCHTSDCQVYRMEKDLEKRAEEAEPELL